MNEEQNNQHFEDMISHAIEKGKINFNNNYYGTVNQIYPNGYPIATNSNLYGYGNTINNIDKTLSLIGKLSKTALAVAGTTGITLISTPGGRKLLPKLIGSIKNSTFLIEDKSKCQKTKEYLQSITEENGDIIFHYTNEEKTPLYEYIKTLYEENIKIDFSFDLIGENEFYDFFKKFLNHPKSLIHYTEKKESIDKFGNQKRTDQIKFQLKKIDNGLNVKILEINSNFSQCKKLDDNVIEISDDKIEIIN